MSTLQREEKETDTHSKHGVEGVEGFKQTLIRPFFQGEDYMEERQEPIVFVPKDWEPLREADSDDQADSDDEKIPSIMPTEKKIIAMMKEIGVEGLAETEWDGTAGHCNSGCPEGTHPPNQAGRFANLVNTSCDNCTLAYCHDCRPVFMLHSGEFWCYHCIDGNEEAEVNPVDRSRFDFVFRNM